MKKMFGYALLFLGLVSCTKVEPNTSPKSEIDFSAKGYFTPIEIASCKIKTECGDNTTPYWQDKTLNIQGYTWGYNIDSVGKSFFLYAKPFLSDIVNPPIFIYYESKDSLAITKLLLNNKDKHCYLTVKCLSEANPAKFCEKVIRFTLQKSEDIEFQ